MKIPMIGICRHRLTTDGQGVTTLVAFHGCPLRCKYCLNAQCLRADGVWRQMTVQEILDEVMVDDLYFKATNGGITFGGGEPLLRSDEIADFCKRCSMEWAELREPSCSHEWPSRDGQRRSQWRIYVETSLNVKRRALETVAPYIDHYYIDVKDMNPDIYRRYTSIDNSRVLENLRWLTNHEDLKKVTIRLPLIPGYNTQKDRDQSMKQLEAMGFKDFDCFEYITPNEAH